MPEGILVTKDYKKFRVGDGEFESAVKAGQALPGDRVFLENGSITSILKRAPHKGLVGVLEVSSKTKYGFTCRGTPVYLFIPWNESYPPFYVGSNHSITSPVLAVVDFDKWTARMNCPRGNCRFVIGPCGELESEQRALLLHYCPNPWKKSVIPPELHRRAWNPTSMIEGDTFHVDPEGCLDIDDAITFIPSENDDVKVYIHIADVGSLLYTNPSLQRAEELGQTLYSDGKVVAGLFPESVEKACSLLPFQTRATLTLSFLWNNLTSTMSSIEWLHCYVVVKESYTYDSIYKSTHAPMLKRIASTMASRILSDSHDWIAEFMLFYNKEAAKCIKELNQGILRRHGAPDMELLDTLKGFDSVPNYVAFQSGEYCSAGEKEVFHWGLQEGIYCHASSPIRRYVDCINQISIMKIRFDYPLDIVPYSIDQLNQLSKRAKSYERDMFFVKNVLETSVVYGYTIAVTSTKAKVWIQDWKIILKVNAPIQGWQFGPKVGSQICLEVSVDPKQRNWKRKIVIVIKPLENITV